MEDRKKARAKGLEERENSKNCEESSSCIQQINLSTNFMKAPSCCTHCSTICWSNLRWETCVLILIIKQEENYLMIYMKWSKESLLFDFEIRDVFV